MELKVTYGVIRTRQIIQVYDAHNSWINQNVITLIIVWIAEQTFSNWSYSFWECLSKLINF